MAVSSDSRSEPFFFSGCYGQGTDWLNDFAVRTHGFYDENWDQIPPKSPGHRAQYNRAVKAIRTFLSDLYELGAPQFPYHESEPYFSANLKALRKRRGGYKDHRRSAQAISGAGLAISYLCTKSLPPLMNFNEFDVWVDDHFKRRLHEQLNHIPHGHPESLKSAVCIQERFEKPVRITLDDINWYFDEYLMRLLRGCCLISLASNLDGTPSEYSRLVHDIVTGVVLEGNARVLGPGLTELRKKCRTLTDSRYDEVLSCWQSIEFEGFRIYDWAKSRAEDAAIKTQVCGQVVKDAIDYIRLLLKWHLIVQAIEVLPDPGNYWLYRPPV